MYLIGTPLDLLGTKILYIWGPAASNAPSCANGEGVDLWYKETLDEERRGKCPKDHE